MYAKDLPRVTFNSFCTAFDLELDFLEKCGNTSGADYEVSGQLLYVHCTSSILLRVNFLLLK